MIGNAWPAGGRQIDVRLEDKKGGIIMGMLGAKDKSFWVEAEVEIPCVKREIRNVVVEAKTKKDAVEKCRQDLEKKGFGVYGVSKRVSPIPGILFLGVTAVMSFFPYFEKGGFNAIFLYPNSVSLCLSIALYSAFVIRIKGLENTFKNVLDISISILFIFVMGIFIKILAGDTTMPAGWFGKLLKELGLGNNYPVLITAIALSWLGLKQIAGFVWLVLIGLAMSELVTMDRFMGEEKASLFVLSVFLGSVFYLRYEGRSIINSFGKAITSATSTIGSDIKESQNLAQKGVSAAASSVGQENIKTEGGSECL